MPELPEVETVMRGLRKVLEGRVIRAASIARPDLRWPFPDGLAVRLTGARVEGFRRRGKYMLMRLSGGDSVLIHLGMSGRMVARRAADLPNQPAAQLRADRCGDSPRYGQWASGAARETENPHPPRKEVSSYYERAFHPVAFGVD